MTTLVCVLAIVGVILATRASFDAAWGPVLEGVGETHGLKVVHGLLQGPSATGTLDDIPVTIDLQWVEVGDESERHTCIEMVVPMPEGLSITRARTAIERRFDRGDFQIGDPRFDTQIAVRGPERPARALLDQEARAALCADATGRLDVEDGRVKWAMEGRADAQTMTDALAKVRQIAGLLKRPATTGALAHIVRTDEPRVAAAALRVMPAGPESEALDAQIVASRSDRLALVAAKRIGRDAVPCLMRILDEPGNPDALRAEALTWLARYVDATDLARAHLPRPAIAVAALPILEQARSLVSLQRLAVLFEAGAETAIPALRAARRHGEAAEPLLITAVASENARVALVAADGLGLVGTATAVMPLRARVEGRRVNGQLESAVSAAIRSIQGRVRAEGGEVSVVQSSAAGRLSDDV